MLAVPRWQSVLSPLSFFFFFFFHFLSCLVSLRLCLLCLFVLYVILALWPPAIQYQLPALFFVCVLFVLIFFVVVLSGVPKQNQRRGLVDRKLVKAPSNFIVDRPKAALLFWFFSGFRCGVWLFFVILFRYKNRKYVKINI